MVKKLRNQCFYNHLFAHHWGTGVVESQRNEHVETHIHGQNVGFLVFQAPNMAGSQRKLPYPLLNTVVNCVVFGVDKVALEEVFYPGISCFHCQLSFQKMSCTHLLLGDH